MKKFIKYTGIAFLAASFLTACTGAFEDMNTDPKGVTDEELKQDGNYIGAHFVSYDEVGLLQYQRWKLGIPVDAELARRHVFRLYVKYQSL